MDDLLLVPDDGPASAPADRPRQGLLPGPVWRYEVPPGTPSGERSASIALEHVVRPGQVLRYAVFPVFDGAVDDVREAYRATAVSVDLVTAGGARLSTTGTPDQHGIPLDPAAQSASKTVAVDQWTLKTVALHGLVGERVVRAEVRVDVTAARGFVGYLSALAVVDAPSEPVDPVDRVRTTRGTHGTAAYSRGGTAPLVGVPHGAVFGVPRTDARSPGWLYSWGADDRDDGRPALQAFATSHVPSPWMRDRGVFQVMPAVAEHPPLEPAARALGFDHADEVDLPHLYRVRLDGGIEAAMTAGRFSVLLRFRFPTARGSLVFDQVDEAGGLGLPAPGADGVVRAFVDGPDDSPRMFVWAEVDRPVLAAVADGPTRGSVRVELGADRTVVVRIGTSFLGLDQARRNLQLDVGPGGSFDDVAAASRARWAERLGRVEVVGASDDRLTTLFSNLYRLFLYPNEAAEDVTEDVTVGDAADRDWAYASPFHDLERPHTPTRTGCRIVRGRPLSVNHGFWDTYRTAWPALLLLSPDDAGGLLDGFLQHYRDGGWTSRWSAPGPADLMVGTSNDIVFADAALADVPHLDLQGAYDSALRNATATSADLRVGRKGTRSQTFRGYTDLDVPEGLSWSLDAALNDAGVAVLAGALLDRLPPAHPRRADLAAEREWFTARAARYASVFDARIGLFQGRSADGAWRVADPAAYDPRVWGGDYTETNGWGTAFTAPHDGTGLAALHGGAAGLERLLDRFFAEPETGREQFRGTYPFVIHEMVEARDVRMGMLGLSNQPAHHIPFMYAFTGAHHKTQRIVRQALRRLFLGSEIGQGYPGDEDNGEMSAWWLFAALGLYPLVPGSGEFVLTTPLFERMTITLPHGRRLTVSTVGDPQDDFIRSVTVDGEPWDRISIPRSRLVEGADIVVTLSPEPTGWAGDSIPSAITPAGRMPRQRLDLTGPGAGPAFDDAGEHEVALEPAGSVSVAFAAPARTGLYTVTRTDPGEASWRLEARRTGRDWTVLDERRDERFRWDRQTRPFRIARPDAYDEYRLVATRAFPLCQLELLADD